MKQRRTKRNTVGITKLIRERKQVIDWTGRRKRRGRDRELANEGVVEEKGRKES